MLLLSSCFFVSSLGSMWETAVSVEPLDLLPDAHPIIVCDAGSTGSRCFGYYIHNDTIHTELMGRTAVGISTFGNSLDFEGAMNTLVPSIRRGIARLGNNTSTYVLATGGVRQLGSEVQAKFMRGLNDLFRSTLDDSVQAEVVTGMEEAQFGLFSANYLVGALHLHQVTDPLSRPLGVLDLGGSSLEISLAGPDDTMGSHDDILFSFTDLGTNRVKKLLEEKGLLRYCDFANVSLSPLYLFLLLTMSRKTVSNVLVRLMIPYRATLSCEITCWR